MTEVDGYIYISWCLYGDRVQSGMSSTDARGRIESLMPAWQMTDGTCALCGISFADVVPLNGTDEQIAAQRERLDEWRHRQKGRHAKGKKRKAAEEPSQERAADALVEVSAAESRDAADAAVAKRRNIAMQADAEAAPDGRRACVGSLDRTSGHQRTSN